MEMKPACEKCETALPPDGAARICSYECTWCVPCADGMNGVCPNCSGELLPRPKRVLPT